jgi:hypothetical protein
MGQAPAAPAFSDLRPLLAGDLDNHLPGDLQHTLSPKLLTHSIQQRPQDARLDLPPRQHA